ncbi:hypothetical protein NEISICOT_02479 [Neisseria sicca ATCC 29256]|uniref:Uncharacterized protein n=1 Tax=Neisseria sicca ATCC 29256 TaxID=547045 RepID=C6M7H2_NEISI|nr:hypothetical protein NEISICOT_02479 [Neisseria sicca ATCC 29256]
MWFQTTYSHYIHPFKKGRLKSGRRYCSGLPPQTYVKLNLA